MLPCPAPCPALVLQRNNFEKYSVKAEAKVRAMQARMKEMEVSHDSELSNMHSTLERARKERNALSLAVAAVAMAAVS